MSQLAVAKVNDDDEGDFHVFVSGLDPRQHPIHFDRVREFENHFVYDSIDSDGARDRRHRGVGRHLRNEALGIKLAQLLVAHASCHHWNMIYISVRDHRFQSIFRVTRGELILDMFIPTIGERFLGGR
ncbi:MAG: hypothetical protein DMF75_15280 [Acidobacteria bacterium]|nr:MAG: hypothetical protein DMF75_15280 [Acidobacteriota bacterium]